MRFVSRLFLFALFISAVAPSGAFARAPAPEKPSERSLLYWRYLCQGENQEESVENGQRIFHCTTEGWTVKTQANSGVVREIIDEAL